MIWRLFVITGHVLSLGFFYVCSRHTRAFHAEFARRIRKTFEVLGPTFIKLGQMLSMRPDYIPEQYCNELEHLLDSAAVIPARIMRRRIEDELEKPISNVFQSFHNTPIASASLSQVYKAKLWSGEDVVVKVLRPGVEKLIASDIAVLKLLTKIGGSYVAGKIPKQYWIDLVDQLATWLLQETDYLCEHKNMETMRRELSIWDDVHVPEAYEHLCATRVLVMEYIEGWSLNTLIQMKRNDEKMPTDFDVADRIIRLADQLWVTSLRHGYTHGDVHPANIIMKKDGSMVLLDFGLIQYFDEHMRNYMIIFLLGSSFASPELVVRATHKLARVPDDFDEEAYYRSISEICNQYRDVPASEMSNAQFLFLCINECLKHGFIVPWPLIIYSRATTGFDGMVLKINPDFILSKHARSLFLQLYVTHVLGEARSMPRLISLFDDFWSLMKDAPENLRTFVNAYTGAGI